MPENQQVFKGKRYKCLYNHELLSLFTTQTPYQTYDENVTDEQVIGYVKELEGTQVDALMCCPQSWRTNLWYSEIDRRWQDEAPYEKEPLPEANWSYNDKAYFRTRRYMLQHKDPVALSLQTAREIGVDFFIAYRMNDHHYVKLKHAQTHGSFWRSHPEYLLEPTGSAFNYLVPEVRDYYFSLLKELAENYDIDGMELDLMRSPRYFPDNQIAEGTLVMNEFIRRIRSMLNDIGESRGKHLSLSVRVPHRIAEGLKVGLDTEAWDREGLVDMVNISSYFKTTLEIGIEEYKSRIKNALIYGELHFVTNTGSSRSALGYSNNINRKTTKEIYETAALQYWKRGVDGISFFNYGYTRDHGFHEPRRKEYPGKEPQFSTLNTICDIKYLEQLPQHYLIGTNFGTFPADQEVSFKVHLVQEGKFSHAVLRLETDTDTARLPLTAQFNGVILQEKLMTGELFTPFSLECLPPQERLRYYELPLELIKQGDNQIRLANNDPYKKATFVGTEIALYRS
ncbi:hypothetical protein OB236_10625 [Paenibacillus sp. WQ 127069]|uniref:Glycosyl hydrolase-like 10 domain-containing protein n=1 Tax=Paenibacillus baimaensis TaxID=2982185 RepID=A0ABT2UDA2_9BACL|nr:hypothetical protein [Paenibacillus sp. WQ 127069]MCU6792577.1 hypothetical protein [Paenibacillus sp. WQ 127069]